MRKLIYSMGVSLDGFIAGHDGDIDWSAPDEELHRFHNQQTLEIGAHLCGRRLYEAMLYWETADEKPLAPEHLEFARIWKDIPKIVFSKTLEKVEGNARLFRGAVAGEVAKLKEQPGKDLSVGGAGLASTLIKLGLVDEYRLFVSPVVLGGGTPYFPTLEEMISLELIETRTFGSRVVYVRYRRVWNGVQGCCSRDLLIGSATSSRAAVPRRDAADRIFGTGPAPRSETSAMTSTRWSGSVAWRRPSSSAGTSTATTPAPSRPPESEASMPSRG
jgi:dihydrofolate reductase